MRPKLLAMNSESLPRLPHEGKDGRHCWVIKWDENERYSFTKNFLYVLPWRWTANQVLEHVLSVYHNSPLVMIFERGDWMNSKTQQGLFIEMLGPKIIVGENPNLVASRVEDFRVVLDPQKRVQIVSYTQPPGVRVKKEANETENVGSSWPVRLEIGY
jgi:hypothetical protein